MRRAFGVAGSAGLLVLGAATSAYAADGSMETDDLFPGGKVTWTKYGDIITACDQDADGHAASVSVNYYKGGQYYGYSLTAGGNGTCKTRRASDGGVYNLPEGAMIKIEICLAKDNSNGVAVYTYCDTAYYDNNA
ncbi:hypothetical protein [Streptomyces sp. LKA04]|uniref:hypothetical protein n=1 Tax=Streptomyces sp. LKA04 TaxID=3398092 RepID=UPI003A81136A